MLVIGKCIETFEMYIWRKIFYTFIYVRTNNLWSQPLLNFVVSYSGATINHLEDTENNMGREDKRNVSLRET